MAKKRTKTFKLGNAAMSGKGRDGVEILTKERKASVDATNTHGNSSLLIAAARGHAKMMAVLLGAGSDVDHRGDSGRTALMKAAKVEVKSKSLGYREGESDHRAAVMLLLACKADATLHDDFGCSALQLALQAGHGEFAAVLNGTCGHSALTMQPGWGANATVHLFAHNQPRRAASPRPPPPEELAVLQECVRQAAAALNECVGRDLIVPHECRDTVPDPNNGWISVPKGLGGDGENPVRVDAFMGSEEQEEEESRTEESRAGESRSSAKIRQHLRPLSHPGQASSRPHPERPKVYSVPPDVIGVPVSIEVFDNPKRCGNTWSTRLRSAHPKGVLTTACVEIKARGQDAMLNTLLHELGHALGLHHHLADPSEMMTRHDGGYRGGVICIGATTSRALKWLYNPDIPAAMLEEGQPIVCSHCYQEGWQPNKLVSKNVGSGVYAAHSNYLRAGRQARPARVQGEQEDRARPRTLDGKTAGTLAKSMNAIRSVSDAPFVLPPLTAPQGEKIHGEPGCNATSALGEFISQAANSSNSCMEGSMSSRLPDV